MWAGRKRVRRKRRRLSPFSFLRGRPRQKRPWCHAPYKQRIFSTGLIWEIRDGKRKKYIVGVGNEAPFLALCASSKSKLTKSKGIGLVRHMAEELATARLEAARPWLSL